MDLAELIGLKPACEKIFASNAVCPKGVQPGTAIQRIRKIL